mmetsp:Transcript_8007/g.15668  ORF Transcript_8007/g.15668 Transcript_8007/m.15668 type:complete len:87 (-) Transcript_8007:278-538(-)
MPRMRIKMQSVMTAHDDNDSTHKHQLCCSNVRHNDDAVVMCQQQSKTLLARDTHRNAAVTRTITLCVKELTHFMCTARRTEHDNRT